jgi:hypothetical protein
MELEQKIQELQYRRLNLRRRMNANHDPFILKFPPEIASHIFSLSMEVRDYEPNTAALHELPTPFLLGNICSGASWHGQHPGFGQPFHLLLGSQRRRKLSLNSEPLATGCSYQPTYR